MISSGSIHAACASNCRTDSVSILFLGAAGFIGVNFVLDWLPQSDARLINRNKLTYAGNLETLASLKGEPRRVFMPGDIADGDLVVNVLAEHWPRAILSVAAESHVDRGLQSLQGLLHTNIVGSFCLFEAARYSDLMQARASLHVKEHRSAMSRMLQAGEPSHTYSVGGWKEKLNIEIVQTICAPLDELRLPAHGRRYQHQIAYVRDRPSHDRRYAIDACEIERELGWEAGRNLRTRHRQESVVSGPPGMGSPRAQHRLPRLGANLNAPTHEASATGQCLLCRPPARNHRRVKRAASGCRETHARHKIAFGDQMVKVAISHVH